MVFFFYKFPILLAGYFLFLFQNLDNNLNCPLFSLIKTTKARKIRYLITIDNPLPILIAHLKVFCVLVNKLLAQLEYPLDTVQLLTLRVAAHLLHAVVQAGQLRLVVRLVSFILHYKVFQSKSALKVKKKELSTLLD